MAAGLGLLAEQGEPGFREHKMSPWELKIRARGQAIVADCSLPDIAREAGMDEATGATQRVLARVLKERQVTKWIAVLQRDKEKAMARVHKTAKPQYRGRLADAFQRMTARPRGLLHQDEISLEHISAYLVDFYVAVQGLLNGAAVHDQVEEALREGECVIECTEFLDILKARGERVKQAAKITEWVSKSKAGNGNPDRSSG